MQQFDTVTQEPLHKSCQYNPNNLLINFSNKNAPSSPFGASTTPPHIWSDHPGPPLHPLPHPSTQLWPLEAPHCPQPPRAKTALWVLLGRTRGPDVLETEGSREGSKTLSSRTSTSSGPATSYSEGEATQLYIVFVLTGRNQQSCLQSTRFGGSRGSLHCWSTMVS